jgi:hypothetical protein
VLLRYVPCRTIGSFGRCVLLQVQSSELEPNGDSTELARLLAKGKVGQTFLSALGEPETADRNVCPTLVSIGPFRACLVVASPRPERGLAGASTGGSQAGRLGLVGGRGMGTVESWRACWRKAKQGTVE